MHSGYIGVSQPVDHIQLAHCSICANPQIVILCYDQWKSTVIIELEDVVFPVVDRSGIGR